VNGSERGQAIANVLGQWALGYDERDAVLMEGCFTDDAVLVTKLPGDQDETSCVGRRAILEHFTSHQRAQTEQRRHIVTNIVIDDHGGNVAEAQSYLTVVVRAASGHSIVATGRYRDQLVLQGGSWRIRLREVILD
jgi:ketosteroid isomerase-like protein